MEAVLRNLVVALALVSLAGCTTLRSTAQQPKDGPRARIRLAGWADEMQIDVRQPDGRKGTLYSRSGFYPGDIGNLGMPIGPAGKQGRNEYYVVGDQDVTVRVDVTLVEKTTPAVSYGSKCRVNGSLHVEAGKDYEVLPILIKKPGTVGIIKVCLITASELVPSASGGVVFKELPVKKLPLN